MNKSYRYEASITLVIYADGQDAAWSLAREAANAARVSSRRATVEQSLTSMTDLHYRPPAEQSSREAEREWLEASSHPSYWRNAQ